ncbi:hypothetical protein DSO57_1006115 [Entomophthora muscae]|uniref:Uncharacterized protein n=1 Tax=Entomophthora muscae TaxID=34485 RepID=A0ACC2TIQ4_9FUNG|nr:hypothetical protein DSO57_1006115 [Entomophthora muscae]
MLSIFFLTLPCLVKSVVVPDIAVEFRPRKAFFPAKDPKNYRVPARPAMEIPFNPETDDPFKIKVMKSTRASLITAFDLNDEKRPITNWEEKLNLTMRILFEDGDDILNYLYNSPTTCTTSDSSQGHILNVSGSQVTISYINPVVVDPAALRSASQGESIHVANYQNTVYTDNPPDYTIQKNNLPSEDIYTGLGPEEKVNLVSSQHPYYSKGKQNLANRQSSSDPVALP